MENKKKLAEFMKKKYPKNVYTDIFSILNGSKYTTNNNGIFINLDDVTEEKIEKCLSYFNDLEHNIEDHFKNLSIRENIEMEYKSKILQSNKKTKKTTEQTKVSKQKAIKNPFVVKKLTGVYDRIDRVIRGVKQDEKNKRKVVEEESTQEEEQEEEVEVSDDEIVEDVDLFGDEDLSDLE
jgi:hypothetical protein